MLKKYAIVVEDYYIEGQLIHKRNKDDPHYYQKIEDGVVYFNNDDTIITTFFSKSAARSAMNDAYCIIHHNCKDQRIDLRIVEGIVKKIQGKETFIWVNQ